VCLSSLILRSELRNVKVMRYGHSRSSTLITIEKVNAISDLASVKSNLINLSRISHRSEMLRRKRQKSAFFSPILPFPVSLRALARRVT